MQLRHHIVLSLGAALFFTVVSLTAGMAAATSEIEFPKLTGRVVDQAGMLSASAQRALDERLAGHERASRNQVVVVTLESLQGRSIEEFGYQLGRHWGIGQAEQDNGVLLIVAPNERRVRVEVGYGLEGTLTDAISSDIVHSVVLPALRRGDVDGGITGGATAIIDALGGQYQMRGRGQRRESAPIGYVGLFFMVAMIGSTLLSSRGGRSRGMRGIYMGPGFGGGSRGGFGGGFGAGGFGGGGGGFGGGGA